MAYDVKGALAARALPMLRGRFAGFLVKGSRGRLIAVGHLLSGNFLNALIMLVSVAMAARSLGPATYGVVVLVLSYNRGVARILSFESWPHICKAYGRERGDQVVVTP